MGMRKELRGELKAKRNQLSATDKMAAAESVATRILAQLPETGGFIAGYWASTGELPLHILQLRLPSNWIWCLPVVQASRQLLFAPWRAGDALATNQYGIPEPTLAISSCMSPESLKIALVPLLGFSRQGQRLGMGGGYYDSSFAFRKNNPASPTLIGIAYACQEVDVLDTQEWDVNMDAIATEREWIDCSTKEST
jgi:5-formyltetrahydrofolate cyclo-ligase